MFETYDVINSDFADTTIPVTLNYPDSINGQKTANYIEWSAEPRVSLFGVPALSVPAGLAGGLPAGLQLVGPRFSESKLISRRPSGPGATSPCRSRLSRNSRAVRVRYVLSSEFTTLRAIEHLDYEPTVSGHPVARDV